MAKKARSSESPFDIDITKVPTNRGLYWLTGADKRLYVGETDNLRERVEVQFTIKNDGFKFWGTPRDELRLSYRPLPDETISLAQHQSRWISKWNPIGNYKALASR